MNPTKSLVTGAVALTAFASVLGLAYAQVENPTDATQTPVVQQEQSSQSTEAAMPADQPASDVNAQSQYQSEAQSTQSNTTQQPQSQDNAWQNQNAASQQDPLPTEPTSAGAPAPRADRN
ncbi:hypothetical protein SAMN05216359_11952 [Roseateles sp. YR242]|uniref:hypothetical protein n=1 Tax=Roseateles sp. YR242 TaxID=1855305 RepID=UPI0008D052F7|nr:hypothetical protein [Roseateles sp. YR242]SEL84639.1 hypothetical protein SAMN05216359_11952 [Roseateles sp. YR242]